MMRFIRRVLLGKPLHNRAMSQEKLPKWKGLAIFSSDAISSVGYGPEQIAIILAVPGILAYGYFGWVALAIVLLLAIVTVSYIQVAKANPGGGGSYSVAIQNLGEWPALVAAAALFADYTLTVAVSVSSGTEALISAFPALLPWEVSLDLFVLFAVLTLINLRGIRESSNVFVAPTYLFIIGILVMVGTGIFQVLFQNGPLIPAESAAKQPLDWAIGFLILRAFASGCSSMTGVEAISNGVPMFKAPEVRNAALTTVWMSGILGVLLLGISFLMLHFHLLPLNEATMLSQLAEIVFGRGAMYYYIQLTTMFVLYLAAKTSYNGLPPLLSILSHDGYMPRYLGFRGERLSFSNGIMLLSLSAGGLIVLFGGNTEHLIALYAIGVFLSFTIAQTGMVVHWRRLKEAGWHWRAAVNGFGAFVTGIVVIVVTVTKFLYGAWIVLLFIPAMIYVFRKIKQHYQDMSEQLHLPLGEEDLLLQVKQGRNIVIMPVSAPTIIVAQTIRYAQTISDKILAVYIATDDESARKIKEKWENWQPENVELVTVNSPYRLVVQPLIRYIEKVAAKKQPEDYITVVIPEFETRKWWHRLLHNQTGFILRTLLILREDVAVTTIPYHLRK